MAIDKEDVERVKSVLMPGETVEITATQRRIGPGGSVLTPTTVVCTNKRIIIVNRATLGIRIDYESIAYKQVTSVRLESGIINGSVFIRVQGYDRDKGLLKGGREEGEIDGLRKSDAKQISDYISKMITVGGGGGAAGEDDESGIFCSKCGAKNSADAVFCSTCGEKLSKAA